MPRIIETLTPVGSIKEHSGGAVPVGYLLCDGTSLLRITYAPLFAAIGTNWGAVDGSHFNLPDLRGRFLRGRDGGIGRDPDRASRTACNSGGNTGDNVGSIQGQATAKNGLSNGSINYSGSLDGVGNHYHYWQDRSQDIADLGPPYLAINPHPAGSLAGGYWTSNPNGNHNHSVSGNLNGQPMSGDNETRMINANVQYIIKY